MKERRRSLLDDMLRDEYPEAHRRMPLRFEQSEYVDINAERILDNIIITAREERKKLRQ